MSKFVPNAQHIIDAALNREAARVPLYEHGVDFGIMEKVLNKKFAALYGGGRAERLEFFKHYIEFYRVMGYDFVNYDQNITNYLPGGGALLRESAGVIKTMEDFQKYPWDEVPDIYFRETLDYFRVFKEALPAGVKALGGVGNGVFECAQDLTGFTNLCYISADDPELYAALFRKVGELIYKIWERFLPEFSDVYAVSRFGDDLGYKSATMLTPSDVRQYIIPEYKRIIELIHAYGKPFMFHSCGNIFEVMDDIIGAAKIDAKHSNEDIIAPFPEWIERYGDRIGNFGGLDVDVLCGGDAAKIREQAAVLVQNYGRGHGGLAVGSGNSIAHYVPVDSYVAMVEAVRMARGE